MADIGYLHTKPGFHRSRGASSPPCWGGLESISRCVRRRALVVGVLENLAGSYIDPYLGGGLKEIFAFIVFTCGPAHPAPLASGVLPDTKRV